ncbi:MAG: RluA family pseudouridine synthase [Solobacterium sp.]|nr:RluA family pseudouridine synthase [Solobacterium sp.]
MKKEFIYLINEKQDGLTIKAILSSSFSRKEISRLKFMQEGIVLNGVKARTNAVVHANDVLKICFDEKDQIHPDNRNIPDILYEDEDLIVINKPSGMPVHPSKGHVDDDAGTMVQNYLHGVKIHTVGRLDQEVSGCMMYAKSQPACARMQRQRENGLLCKEYIAAAEGTFPKRKDTVLLNMDKGKDGIRMEENPDGKKSITEYEVLHEYDGYSVLKVRIITGRRHQIRFVCSHLGHPLLGDHLYGGNTDRIKRVALHAYKLTFLQPFTNKKIMIEAPVPEDIQNLLEGV